MANPINPNFLTTSEAATRIRYRAQTLRRWRMLGRGPAFIRLAGRVLYDPADLQAWLDSHRHESTDTKPAIAEGE